MKNLARALDDRMIEGCNIGRSSIADYQVSVRRAGVDGWEVYYGEDIEETIDRAIRGGPQREDLTGGLV